MYKTKIKYSSFPLVEKLKKYFENFFSLITDNKISKDDFEIIKIEEKEKNNNENNENKEKNENNENKDNNQNNENKEKNENNENKEKNENNEKNEKNEKNENKENDENDEMFLLKDDNNKKNKNGLVLKFKHDKNINIKKCVTDELGINNFITLEYNAKYICYIEDKPKNEGIEDKTKNTENSNNKKHVVILIEIPGKATNFKYDLKLIDNNYNLKITGEKKLSKKLKIENKNIISSTIEEGNFCLNILIPHDEENNLILEKEKEISSLSYTKDGYIRITCDLLNEKKKEFVLNNDDDDD